MTLSNSGNDLTVTETNNGSGPSGPTTTKLTEDGAIIDSWSVSLAAHGSKVLSAPIPVFWYVTYTFSNSENGNRASHTMPTIP
ncbi:MAG: hypothetical protein ACLQPH_14875 [Acidimicrobiales bacterium]